MHEIITLQLGQRSNYLATHFWNAQESYFTYDPNEEAAVDHDVLFRPGIGSDGKDTFTPRTLIYDLKGGFGSLKKINALYDVPGGRALADGLWDGPRAIQTQPAIEENAYQRSLNEGLPPAALTADTVRYWSDFNRVFYHPRSIVQLNQYELNSTLMPFEKWGAGEELFTSLDKEHDLLDRDLRPFAEECDQLQGLQLMTGADDAWAGFAARYVDRLRDEFGKSSIWVWGVHESSRMAKEREVQRTLNEARALYEISEQASIYIPLASPPEIPEVEAASLTSPWVGSAWLSMAVESVMLPPRLRSIDGVRPTMAAIENRLNDRGRRRIGQLQMSRTLPEQAGSDQGHQAGARAPNATIDGLRKFGMDLSISGQRRSRTAGRRPVQTYSQLAIFREPRDPTDATTFGQDDATLHDSGAQAPIITQYRTDVLLPVPDSFPPIDDADWQRSRTEGMAVYAAVCMTSQAADLAEAMKGLVERTVGPDERESLCNGLGEIAEAYQDGWQSDLEDIDDD